MFLGLVALGAIWFLLPNGEQEADSVDVWVVKEAIAAGEELTEDSVSKASVPEAEEWMVSDLNEIKGMRSLRTIAPGRYLDKEDFTSDLPIVFTDGEGEYTIRTKPEYVNGGRIKPGDRVDVIFVPKENGTAETGSFQQGINSIEDVVVLSIRTQYAKGVDDTAEKNDINNVPASVTLKVVKEQAKILAGQQERGTLSLFVKKRGETVSE